MEGRDLATMIKLCGRTTHVLLSFSVTTIATCTILHMQRTPYFMRYQTQHVEVSTRAGGGVFVCWFVSLFLLVHLFLRFLFALFVKFIWYFFYLFLSFFFVLCLFVYEIFYLFGYKFVCYLFICSWVFFMCFWVFVLLFVYFLVYLFLLICFWPYLFFYWFVSILFGLLFSLFVSGLLLNFICLFVSEILLCYYLYISFLMSLMLEIYNVFVCRSVCDDVFV